MHSSTTTAEMSSISIIAMLSAISVISASLRETRTSATPREPGFQRGAESAIRLVVRDGQLAVLLRQAVNNRDYPLIMGVTLMFAAVLVGMNLLVDFAYAIVDPRMRQHSD